MYQTTIRNHRRWWCARNSCIVLRNPAHVMELRRCQKTPQCCTAWALAFPLSALCAVAVEWESRHPSTGHRPSDEATNTARQCRSQNLDQGWHLCTTFATSPCMLRQRACLGKASDFSVSGNHSGNAPAILALVAC